jgi:hypothetical protein
MTDMTDSLCVFTASYGTDKCDLLRRSCGLVDIQLHTYGTGEWQSYVHGKITGALDFLAGRDEPFAMYVDGHDSFIVDNAAAILDKYQRIGKLITISAEKDVWPVNQGIAAAHYPYPQPPHHQSPWKFINSGGWIGERGALIEALSRMHAVANGRGDDQLLWHEWYLFLKGRLVTHIDSGCSIFQTMSGVHGHELSPTGENLTTFQRPSVVHFNGRLGNNGAIGDWYRMMTGDRGYRG